MNDMLPECLEVQYGWVWKYHYIVPPVESKGTVRYYPDGGDEFRLRLMQSGSLLYCYNDQSWRLDCGSLFLQPPYAPGTTTVMRTIEDCRFISVGFRLLLFGSIDITPELLHSPVVWRPDPATYDALDALMRLLYDRSNPATMSASFIRDGLLRAIIGLCWEPLGMSHVTEGQHPRVPRWLAIVLQEIRHYPGMTVTELERLTGYSHTQFCHLFQQYIGMPPRIYLQSNRADVARHLLVTTDMSMTAIGEHLGFINASDFTRFFHRMCQTTPTEYRRTMSLTHADGSF